MSTPATEGPTIRHSIPGRVRIHWPGQGRPALEARLSRLPGVRSARANPLTSTILIHFDPGVTDEKTLLDALRTSESGASPVTFPLPGRGQRGEQPRSGRGALAVKLAAAADVLAIVQSLPLIRDAIRHLLGRPLADLLLLLTRAAAALLAAEPLDLLLAATDSLLPTTTPSPRLLLAG